MLMEGEAALEGGVVLEVEVVVGTMLVAVVAAAAVLAVVLESERIVSKQINVTIKRQTVR